MTVENHILRNILRNKDRGEVIQVKINKCILQIWGFGVQRDLYLPIKIISYFGDNEIKIIKLRTLFHFVLVLLK